MHKHSEATAADFSKNPMRVTKTNVHLVHTNAGHSIMFCGS